MVNRREIHTWLAAMGLDIQDASEAFRLVQAHPDAKLSAQEFVTGTLRLKGNARSIDLASARVHLKNMETKLDQLYDNVIVLSQLRRLRTADDGRSGQKQPLQLSQDEHPEAAAPAEPGLDLTDGGPLQVCARSRELIPNAENNRPLCKPAELLAPNAEHDKLPCKLR